MIKLSKPACISYLSGEKIADLLHQYKTKGNSVWLRKGITKELRKTSFNKCAYCEKKVNGNGSFMEVDHFLCKIKYDSLVIEWSNLVPSCKQCNTKKGQVDVNVYPIINPYRDEPSEHLVYSSLRIKGSTDKGKNTVELFGFNLRDMDARVNRLLILEKIDQLLEDAIEAFNDYENSGKMNQRKIIKSRNIVRGLLSLCQSESEYCAINATLLLLNPNFYLIRTHLTSESFWDTEMEGLFVKAKYLSFPVKKDEYTLVKSA